MATQTAGPQVGEIGLEFVLDTGLDLTAYTTFKINARKPHGVVKVWVAAVKGLATDGKIAYTTLLGDLTHAGFWVLQAEVGDAGGAVIIGEAVEVRVKAAFEV
jgi:hypothetical protein